MVHTIHRLTYLVALRLSFWDRQHDIIILLFFCVFFAFAIFLRCWSLVFFYLVYCSFLDLLIFWSFQCNNVCEKSMKESYSSKKFHEELYKIMYDFMALICGLQMECVSLYNEWRTFDTVNKILNSRVNRVKLVILYEKKIQKMKLLFHFRQYFW